MKNDYCLTSIEEWTSKNYELNFNHKSYQMCLEEALKYSRSEYIRLKIEEPYNIELLKYIQDVSVLQRQELRKVNDENN